MLFRSTDGKLAHRITGPKNHINKKYYVELDKPLQSGWNKNFQNGIIIDDGYRCKPAFFEPISHNTCHLTLFEGKFHQVKRMFEALGCTVTYLKRVQIGSVTLDETLNLGEFRELTQQELSRLETVPEHYKENL